MSHNHYEDPMYSTHGIELNVTGGNVDVLPGTNAELAAAAVSPTEAVIQVDGQSIIAPMDHIDPDKVELACDDTGCALIPDDGNPYNDIIVNDSYAAPMQSSYIDQPYYEGGIDFEDQFHYDQAYTAPASTHGIELNMTGGNV